MAPRIVARNTSSDKGSKLCTPERVKRSTKRLTRLSFWHRLPGQAATNSHCRPSSYERNTFSPRLAHSDPFGSTYNGRMSNTHLKARDLVRFGSCLATITFSFLFPRNKLLPTRAPLFATSAGCCFLTFCFDCHRLLCKASKTGSRAGIAREAFCLLDAPLSRLSLVVLPVDTLRDYRPDIMKRIGLNFPRMPCC